jgi:hypothetical protein
LSGRIVRRCARTRSWLRLAPLSLLVVTAACFEYTTVRPELAQVGRPVRVHLTEPGFSRLSAEAAGALPHLGRVIEGDLVEATGQQMLVAVRVGWDPSVEGDRLQQRLAIPIADIWQVEVRQLNKTKTALIVAGATVAVGSIIVSTIHGQYGGTTIGPQPD